MTVKRKAESADDDGPDDLISENALYLSLNRMEWEGSRELLRKRNAARFLDYVHQTLDRDLTAPMTACMRNPPLDVVETIHRLRPSILSLTNNVVWNPLHLACGLASEEVVEFLLEKGAPSTVAVVDRYGLSPLDVAVYHRRTPSVIEKLLTKHPTAARREWSRSLNVWRREIERADSNLDRLPCHDRNGVDPYGDGVRRFRRTIALLLRSYDHGAAIERPDDDDDDDDDDDGRLWRDALRRSATVPIPSAILRGLFRSTRRADRVRVDTRGNLPLHLACAAPPHRVL